MQKANEFAIPTLLATAWVNLALGGDKTQEACLTFEDIGKKYGACFAALHGIGVCKLAMGKYAESEEALLKALEKVRLPNTMILKHVLRIRTISLRISPLSQSDGLFKVLTKSVSCNRTQNL